MNLLKKIGFGGRKKNHRGTSIKKKTLKKNKLAAKTPDKRTEVLIQQKYQSFGSSHLSVEERSIIIHDRYDNDSFAKSDYFSLPAYESAVNLALKYCCGDDNNDGKAYEEINSTGETSTEPESSNDKASGELGGPDERTTDLFLFESNEHDSPPVKTKVLNKGLQLSSGESTRVIIPETSHFSDKDVKNGNQLYAQIMLRRVDKTSKNQDSAFDTKKKPQPPAMYMSSPSSSESDDNSEDTDDCSTVHDLFGPLSGNHSRKHGATDPGKKDDRRTLLLQDKTKPGTIGISTAVFASLDDSDINEITSSSKVKIETKRLIQKERKRQEEHEREKQYKAMHEKLKNERKQNELIDDRNKSVDIKASSDKSLSKKSSTNTVLYDLLVKGNCVVCKQRSRTHLAVPCMHYSFCEQCSLKLSEKSCQVKCPVCNKEDVLFSKLKY